MEELKEHQIYMLCEVLSERFDEDQWLIISSQPPETFLKRQEIILGKLLDEKRLFDNYFEVFYSNHVKLLNWSVLAVERKTEISAYVFKSLVSKGSSFFNKKIKDLFASRLKKKEQLNQELNLKQIKSLQEEVYKQFFYEMLNKTKVSNEEKHLIARCCSKKKDLQNIDGHQFYIRTFNACNGWKYIFYNYEKHMKGLKEKRKYNDKIRPHQQKSMFERQNRQDLGLLDYEHPQPSQIKNQVYNLNKVLSSQKMNSAKIFRKLVRSSSTNKLCFRNHQGKPITYRAFRV